MNNSVLFFIFLYTITPEDYEPPHFKHSEHESFKFGSGERINFDAGSVESKRHKMKCSVNIAEHMFKNPGDMTAADETFTSDVTTHSINYENPKKKMKLRKPPKVLNKSLSLEDEAPKISNLDLSNPKVEMRSGSNKL